MVTADGLALKNAATAFLMKTHKTRQTHRRFYIGDARQRDNGTGETKTLNNFIKMSVGGDCEQTAFNRVYSFLNKLI